MFQGGIREAMFAPRHAAYAKQAPESDLAAGFCSGTLSERACRVADYAIIARDGDEILKGIIMNHHLFLRIVVAVAILCTSCFAHRGPIASGPAAAAPPGQLVVTFLYMPPTEVEPTYHTAMWLENEEGKLIKTLFVSQELSVNEYKQGVACPDWLKQASWAKAEKSLVDAVTGPTPNVGSGAMSFDLQQLGIAPGKYRFCFQVHIVDKYNVMFRGTVNASQSAEEVKIETLFSPGKPPGDADIIRDVNVQYVPAAVK